MSRNWDISLLCEKKGHDLVGLERTWTTPVAFYAQDCSSAVGLLVSQLTLRTYPLVTRALVGAILQLAGMSLVCWREALMRKASAKA